MAPQAYLGDSGPATSAELNGPYGLAIDNAGNLYIADPANNRVRKVALGTGIISTFAGNGTAVIAVITALPPAQNLKYRWAWR